MRGGGRGLSPRHTGETRVLPGGGPGKGGGEAGECHLAWPAMTRGPRDSGSHVLRKARPESQPLFLPPQNEVCDTGPACSTELSGEKEAQRRR